MSASRPYAPARAASTISIAQADAAIAETSCERHAVTAAGPTISVIEQPSATMIGREPSTGTRAVRTAIASAQTTGSQSRSRSPPRRQARTIAPAVPGSASMIERSISSLMRQWGEFSLIVLALMIVMVAGGIDLSVGSTFALGNIVALALLSVAEWPVCGGDRGDARLRRRRRPRQRPARRLSAPARLPHDARHADHRARRSSTCCC